jgi:hypothetical protein
MAAGPERALSPGSVAMHADRLVASALKLVGHALDQDVVDEVADDPADASQRCNHSRNVCMAVMRTFPELLDIPNAILPDEFVNVASGLLQNLFVGCGNPLRDLRRVEAVDRIARHDAVTSPRCVALKLAGPSPQPRIRRSRSSSPSANMRQYSSNDRPHGTT